MQQKSPRHFCRRLSFSCSILPYIKCKMTPASISSEQKDLSMASSLNQIKIEPVHLLRGSLLRRNLHNR